MVTGIAIGIDDSLVSFANDLLGLSLSTSGQDSEDRYLRRGIDPEPLLFLTFGPDRLINLIDRLPMNILPRCPDWLLQRL
jgi:hypothetical protein